MQLLTTKVFIISTSQQPTAFFVKNHFSQLVKKSRALIACDHTVLPATRQK